MYKGFGVCDVGVVDLVGYGLGYVVFEVLEVVWEVLGV